MKNKNDEYIFSLRKRLPVPCGIWLLLLLATGFCAGYTACSHDDAVTVDTLPFAPVSFRIQDRTPLTRTAATTTGQINALIVNGQITSTDASRSQTLLNGITVYRLKGSESRFDYNPHAFYPSWADRAEFNAYSTVSGRVEGFNISDKEEGTDNTVAYSVPDPALLPQEGLLVASTAVEEINLGGYVLFNMRHALSRIHIRALNLMIYPVIIHHITLHNLYGSGTLDINAKVWNRGKYSSGSPVADINRDYVAAPLSFDDYKILWKPAGSSSASYSWQLPPAGGVVPASGAIEYITSDDQAMLVMPQITRNTGNDAFVTDADKQTDFYIEIGYTIQNYSSTIRAAFVDVNNLPPGPACEGIVFEMGRQYSLTVCFTLEAVTFTVNTGDWYETIVE